jgi:glutathione synthase/RimK-type ligase-like ATP-grasp enzyme
VILVWGSATDPPTERMLTVLRATGADVVHLDDRDLGACRYDVILGPEPAGHIEIRSRLLEVGDITGMYIRPGEAAPGPATVAATTLLGLAAMTPATVVNRPAAGRSNWSKPFQLTQLVQAGFLVPETLVTTDPTAAAAFLERHRRIIYKSVSGIRSIVSTLEASDADRLDGVHSGPVQLQQWISGIDVRVHVVGDRCFATAIKSDGADYRYASMEGFDVTMTPYDIPEPLERRLVALTREMGLLVSGVDLRVTDAGECVAFEVNPSPGFTFFEEGTGQPIAEAISELLL